MLHQAARSCTSMNNFKIAIVYTFAQSFSSSLKYAHNIIDFGRSPYIIVLACLLNNRDKQAPPSSTYSTEIFKIWLSIYLNKMGFVLSHSHQRNCGQELLCCTHDGHYYLHYMYWVLLSIVLKQ